MTTQVKLKACTLIAVFAAILGGVPVVQVGIEWRRGGRIEAMDLFRYSPSAGNLRRYERSLAERSWAAAVTRPVAREVWFELLGDAGSEVLLGREGWLFYRPGVRHLMRGERPGARPVFGSGRVEVERSQRALEIIEGFRGRLWERGIQLVVVPVPGKAAVYPDRLSDRYDRETMPRSPTEDFIGELRGVGVEVIDLFDVFRQAHDPGRALYLEQDTHWTPAGAELAARVVSDRLRELGWVGTGTTPFEVHEVQVLRRGDIVGMSEVRGLKRRYPGEVVTCRQVIDPVFGLLVPSSADRADRYRSPRDGSRILVLGDSYCRVFQYAESRSLGEVIGAGEVGVGSGGLKRLLPGSAGFVSHLTRMLGDGVDAIVSDGSGATEVRKRLSVSPEILEGKGVVVWAFAERELGLSEWEEVPLPPRLGGGE